MQRIIQKNSIFWSQNSAQSFWHRKCFHESFLNSTSQYSLQIGVSLWGSVSITHYWGQTRKSKIHKQSKYGHFLPSFGSHRPRFHLNRYHNGQEVDHYLVYINTLLQFLADCPETFQVGSKKPQDWCRVDVFLSSAIIY